MTKSKGVAVVVVLCACAIGLGLAALLSPEARAAECYAGPCVDGVREVCCLELVPAGPGCKKCPSSWEWVCELEACYY